MNEIPRNRSERQDSILVTDHFSKKKKMKKTFFVKQYFKHQLTLQDKQSLGEFSENQNI